MIYSIAKVGGERNIIEIFKKNLRNNDGSKYGNNQNGWSSVCTVFRRTVVIQITYLIFYTGHDKEVQKIHFFLEITFCCLRENYISLKFVNEENKWAVTFVHKWFNTSDGIRNFLSGKSSGIKIIGFPKYFLLLKWTVKTKIRGIQLGKTSKYNLRLEINAGFFWG